MTEPTFLEEIVLNRQIELLEKMINEMIEKGYDDKIVATRIPSNYLKKLIEKLNQKTTAI